MSPREIAQLTGLNETRAVRAMRRDFSEPFVFQDNEKKLDLLEEKIREHSLKLTKGGRFYHLIGERSDKGSAVELLIEAYRTVQPDLISVALGDSPNDLPMLKKVDVPFLVGKPGGAHDPGVRFPGLRLAQGIGPKGWNRVVLDLLRPS